MASVRQSAAKLPGGYSVSGVTGDRSFVNGTYKKTGKVVHGKPVYEMITDATKSLFFSAYNYPHLDKWMLTSTADAVAGKSAGYASNDAGGLPDSQASAWKVATSGDPAEWILQTAVKVIGVTADDVSFFEGSNGVSIYGATGTNAELVNGTFKKTSKVVNGKPVYEMVTDATKSLFFSSSQKWLVCKTDKAVAGSDRGFAYIAKTTPTPFAEDAEWQVLSEDKWEKQADVGATSLTADQIDFLENGAGFSLAGVPYSSNESANGSYKKTAEVINGKPVYRNLNDTSYAVFVDSDQNWMVASGDNVAADSNRGLAYLNDAGCPTPVGAATKWLVVDSPSNKWLEQAAFEATVLTEGQLDFLESGLAITITQCTGPHMGIVMGTYAKTKQVLNGKPVYTKITDLEVSLMFSVQKRWVVTDTAGLAADEEGVIFASIDVPGLDGAISDTGVKCELHNVTVKTQAASYSDICDVGNSIPGILIAGLTSGDSPLVLDGVYRNRKPGEYAYDPSVFIKVDDPGICCYYNGGWRIAATQDGTFEGGSSARNRSFAVQTKDREPLGDGLVSNSKPWYIF